MWFATAYENKHVTIRIRSVRPCVWVICTTLWGPSTITHSVLAATLWAGDCYSHPAHKEVIVLWEVKSLDQDNKTSKGRRRLETTFVSKVCAFSSKSALQWRERKKRVTQRRDQSTDSWCFWSNSPVSVHKEPSPKHPCHSCFPGRLLDSFATIESFMSSTNLVLDLCLLGGGFGPGTALPCLQWFQGSLLNPSLSESSNPRSCLHVCFLPRQTQNFSCNGALRMGLLSEVVDLW
jgi:hypothetical protein